MNRFSDRIVAWQRTSGRHDLPWQQTRDPYRIWLSEIMLQQTQVAAVIPYFERFMQRFPDLAALADASIDDVMQLWSGLGYYSRARNLHRCAQALREQHHGRFPHDPAVLEQLPGIGRSTAAAIAVFAFGKRAAILDGNVKRVFCRYFGIEGFPGERSVEKRLWDIADRELPDTAIESYTQGLMDLGATLCTRSRPRCGECPLQQRCAANTTLRTDILPTARPRKATVWRHALLLVLRHGSEVLLERRPDSGIWGGLWSLPQSAFEDNAIEPGENSGLVAPLLKRHGMLMVSLRVLEPVDHAFTHFRLRAIPLCIDVIRDQQHVHAAEPGTLWLDLAEVGHAALPRPVKTLLLSL